MTTKKTVSLSDQDTYHVTYGDDGEPGLIVLHRVMWVPGWPQNTILKKVLELAAMPDDEAKP
jgi:hypothetical protein